MTIPSHPNPIPTYSFTTPRKAQIYSGSTETTTNKLRRNQCNKMKVSRSCSHVVIIDKKIFTNDIFQQFHSNKQVIQRISERCQKQDKVNYAVFEKENGVKVRQSYWL